MHDNRPGFSIFLAGGGETGALMRARDWRSSPLGEPATWPQSLRTLVGVILGSSQPMFVAWGPERVMLYNDGYAAILGLRHPAALGARFEDVWFDILETVGSIMDRAYGGHPTQMDDIAYIMHRNGYPEETHFSFSYTPVRDETGLVAGMFCTCTETTDRVLSERRYTTEIERQRQLFERAPGFVAILSGPDHVFEFVNAAYARVFGRRDFNGRSVRDVFPDVEGQGIYELLDRVYSTGERFVAEQLAIKFRPSANAVGEERLLDFIYEPMIDETGKVTGIFVQGYEVTERARAEAQVSNVLENITEGFVLLDRDFRVLKINAAGLRLEDRPAEEIIGRLHWEAWSSSEQSELGKLYKHAMAERIPVSLEHEYTYPDGREVWIEMRAYPSGDELAIFYRDVTERKRAEQAVRETEERLRASEKKLRQIADNIPALIGYVDADQRYRFNNKAYQTWMGRSPEDLYGLHLREAVGPEAYELVKPYIEAALAGKRSGHEWWAPFNGRWRYVKSEYIPDHGEDGSIVGFHVLASDLTEYKHSEAALIESEARLRLAIDAGRMAIWELDVQREVVSGSRELNQLFGFPPEATPSLAEFRARYLPGERERMQAIFKTVLAKGERFIEAESACVWPDGSIRWLLLRGEIHLTTEGAPSKVVGVLLDITERKRAEDHQQLLINELNHRVKNTLATVQSIVSQTLRNASSSEQAQSDLESRLLALSRTHDVLTRENWEGASLGEIAAQAFEPYKNYDEGRFHCHGPEVRLLPRMALALSMALHELATNAVKYGALSNAAGKLSLTWSVDHSFVPPRLHLRWEELGGPFVEPPARRGFGTRLIERSLAQDLEGDAKIEFAPTGVVCTVDAPLS